MPKLPVPKPKTADKSHTNPLSRPTSKTKTAPAQAPAQAKKQKSSAGNGDRSHKPNPRFENHYCSPVYGGCDGCGLLEKCPGPLVCNKLYYGTGKSPSPHPYIYVDRSDWTPCRWEDEKHVKAKENRVWGDPCNRPGRRNCDCCSKPMDGKGDLELTWWKVDELKAEGKWEDHWVRKARARHGML